MLLSGFPTIGGDKKYLPPSWTKFRKLSLFVWSPPPSFAFSPTKRLSLPLSCMFPMFFPCSWIIYWKKDNSNSFWAKVLWKLLELSFFSESSPLKDTHKVKIIFITVFPQNYVPPVSALAKKNVSPYNFFLQWAVPTPLKPLWKFLPINAKISN